MDLITALSIIFLIYKISKEVFLEKVYQLFNLE
jgi:hypothetical protein